MVAMTKTSRSFTFIIAAILLIGCLGLYLACRDHSGYYKERKGNLVSAELSPYQPGQYVNTPQKFTRHQLLLKSDSGLHVQCGLLVPKQEVVTVRHPVVVLLAGLETGQHAIDYVRNIPNVIIAAVDYPYSERDLDSPRRVLAEMAPLHNAALDTVPSAMLLIDYLLRRPDVDKSKVILVGLSLGGIFVPCIAAEDRRPAVAVMAFAGGDLRRIIKQDIRSFGEFESDTLSFLGGLLVRPIEPLRYADKISPIPLLMINGTRDGMVPRQSTEEMFRKAKPPKKLVWLDSEHIMPGDLALTREIVETLKKELREMKVLDY
jgi:hypothetical protein